MKILFSNPPWFVGDREGIRAGSRWPHTRPRSAGGYYPYPFYLGYAASYLRSRGYDATMRDSILSRESYESYFDYIKRERFDYIFIETGSPCWEHDRALIQKILFGQKIVLVGPHATIFADELMKDMPYFAVVKGEYEKNALKIVETGEGKIYDYDLTENLDDLPFPYRDDLIYKYWDGFPNTPSGPQLQI